MNKARRKKKPTRKLILQLPKKSKNLKYTCKEQAKILEKKGIS
ncbi:16355_t:CDS:2 [Gigaspora rosea]|nr:16355_t:CDS:2 [Gigaspora rosea]